MRKLYLGGLMVLGLACASLQVQAGEWFYGFKVAYFEIEVSGVDDPDNAGFLVGYDWDIEHGSIGIEGEITTTFEDGSFGANDVEMDTAGIYGVYKTRGPGTKGMGPYVKLKAGAAYTDLTLGDVSEDDTNFSYGVGVGINMAAVSFELELTNIDDDIDLLSLTFRF